MRYIMGIGGGGPRPEIAGGYIIGAGRVENIDLPPGYVMDPVSD